MKTMGKILLRLLAVVLLIGVWFTVSSPVPYASSNISSDPAPTSGVSEQPELTPNPTPAPTPTPTPEPQVFTLSFVGDCTLASNQYYVGSAVGYEGVVGTNYAYPFAETIQYFEEDDFTFANLECPLTTCTAIDRSKTFYFRADPASVAILKEGSVEFVTLGNNHALDYGTEGYQETRDVLTDAGIGFAGRDEWALYETESGLVIGVYAVSFGTTEQVRAGIKAVQDAGAEFVIAAIHWGTEGSYDITNDQIALAHAAVDAGADFVYGSHPHTLQPVELYEGVYIYYCVGNWTFGGNTNPRDKDTLIVRLTVTREPDGAVSVTDVENIPCASSGTTDANNYQPVPYDPDSEGYQRVLDKLDGSFTGANLNISYAYGDE